MKNTLKNKNKNLKLTTLAFTLIELLAVIVILAIIALIATPIILGIVEDARKDSFMRSVELVVGTTDIDIFNKDFNDSYTYTITDGVVSNLEVGVKNTDGMNGSITYDKNGNDTYAIHNGKYCVIKTKGMKKAEIKDYVEGECELSNSTNKKYFTYEEISEKEYEYKIIDKNACVDYYVEEQGYSEYNATGYCNNERIGGRILTQWLLESSAQEEIAGLKEAGAIEEIIISLEGLEITGYSEEGPKDVIIPEKIDGKAVVSIGSFAFADMLLNSIELPSTLVAIKYGALSRNLFTNMTLPDGLEKIGDFAFCYNDLNETTLNNIDEINEYAWCGTPTDASCFTYSESQENSNQINLTGYQCSETDVVIPEEIDGKEVISIAENTFSFGDLTSVVIPKGIKSLNGWGFIDNYSLQRAFIESSNTSLDAGSFCHTSLNIESYTRIAEISTRALECPPI